MVSVQSTLFCVASAFLPLAVSPQEVTDQRGAIEFLTQASRRNTALLRHGRINASVTLYFSDEQGRQSAQGPYEMAAFFTDTKVRLDWKEQTRKNVVNFRTVATQDDFKHYCTGETTAYIRDPRAAKSLWKACSFLPAQNPTFWLRVLELAISGEQEPLSTKILRKGVGDHELYVVELVWKKEPKNLFRYHIAPAKGAAVVRYESYHDFGKGHVLLRETDAQMQQTTEGAWFLKRYTDVLSSPEGTLIKKEQIEVNDFDFKTEVPDEVFTWEGIGLPHGTTIVETRMANLTYTYGTPAVNESIVRDLLHQPLVQEVVAKDDPNTQQDNQQLSPATPTQGPRDAATTTRQPRRNNLLTASRKLYLLLAAAIVVLVVTTSCVLRRRKFRAGTPR